MDCSQPSSSVHGILQTRLQEWVAMSSSRGASRPGDQTRISCISYTVGGCLLLSHWGSPKMNILVHLFSHPFWLLWNIYFSKKIWTYLTLLTYYHIAFQKAFIHCYPSLPKGFEYAWITGVLNTSSSSGSWFKCHLGGTHHGHLYWVLSLVVLLYLIFPRIA